MDAARPLRDVFADLAGGGADGADPAQLLRASGHPDLPGQLVAEAVVNFADTAPVETAEHLAPYVMAQSPVAGADPGEVATDDWLDAFSSTPAGPDSDPGDLDDLPVPSPSPVSTQDSDHTGAPPAAYGDGHDTVDAWSGTPATEDDPQQLDHPYDLDGFPELDDATGPAWTTDHESDVDGLDEVEAEETDDGDDVLA